MRTKIALILAYLLAGGVAQAAAPALNVESGYKVQLRNMAFDENERGGAVTGWASRALGAFGPIEAHLHVDLMGKGSKILRRVEHGLSGSLPVRPQRAESIRVPLSVEQLEGVDKISVKVAPGRRHRE